MIATFDDALPAPLQKRIDEALRNGPWKFGWKSDANDPHAFWHRHFAGSPDPDHLKAAIKREQYDCAEELQRCFALVHEVWMALNRTALSGHALRRCYANAFPFGSQGTLHTDSASSRSFTSIYYPHEEWNPNWGGETVFFNREKTDILAAIYPRPNRLAVFPGTLYHVARGVARTCPRLRITLMFKTELE